MRQMTPNLLFVRHSVSVAMVAAAAGTTLLLFVLTVSPQWGVFTVDGSSMAPAYERGDLIITKRAAASTLTAGDSIVFLPPWTAAAGQPVVHRLVAISAVRDKALAFTRGDANLVADPVPLDVTAGADVVRLHVAGLGKWLNLFAGPLAVALAATIGVALAGFAGTRTGYPGTLRRSAPANGST